MGGYHLHSLGSSLAVNLAGWSSPWASVYLVVKAPELEQKLRGAATAIIAAALVWSLDRLLPVNPGAPGYELDPLYLPAAAAGLIAYLLGRSRRASFIGGVVAVLLLDLSAWVENMLRGFRNIPIILGGAVFLM